MSDVPPHEGFNYSEEENEEQQQNEDSGSSSASGNSDIPPKPLSSSAQEGTSIFHIGGDSPPHVSVPQPRRGGFSVSNLAPTDPTNIFAPISMHSFEPEFPNNPNYDSSLYYRDHPVVPLTLSQSRPVSDSSVIIGDQMGVVHSQPSPAMGTATQGHSFDNQQIIPSFGSSFDDPGTYNLPGSNLPSDFRSDSSSIMQLYSQPTPLGASPWPNSSAQNQITMNQPLNPTGSHEVQFPGQSSFYHVAGGEGSSQNQALNMPISPAHGIGSQSLTLHVDALSTENNQNKRRINENFLNLGQFTARDIPARSPKRQTTVQEGNYFPQPAMTITNPNFQFRENWPSQGQSSLGLNNSSIGQNPRPRRIRNSVYDPLYEQMGLPIDPHLRMFLARRESGRNGNCTDGA